MKIEEGLRQARDHLLNGERWVQGVYLETDDDGERSRPHHHCFVGAIQCVASEVWMMLEEGDELTIRQGSYGPSPMVKYDILDLINENYKPREPQTLGFGMPPAVRDRFFEIEAFNDEKTRTWEDVERIFDKAIALAAERGV